MKLQHQNKKVKKNLQILDYGKIMVVSDLFKPILLRKILFEVQFFVISFYSLLLQNFNLPQNCYKILLYGALLMFRRIVDKMHEYQKIHDPMKQTLITKSLYLFMGIFYMNFFYVLVKLIIETQATTTIFISYQYLIYFFIGSKLRKDSYHGSYQYSIVEYYLKNALFRIYDCSYFHLLIVLQSIQTQNDSSSNASIMVTLFKWNTFSRPLIICITSNIYLFIMSVAYLTREKGELLKSHAKNLSLWFKLSANELDPRVPIVEWNQNEDKYSPNVIVHYNNNYYILKNHVNTTPPEDIKVVFIQLLFYDIKKSTRMMTILLFIGALVLNITTFYSSPWETMIYNILLTIIIVPLMKQNIKRHI